MQQLSLFDVLDLDEKSSIPLPPVITESKEAYELRRTVEMAAKLHWPALQIEPVRRWPGVTIAEGESAWREFFVREDTGAIGIVMMAIHKRLNPLELEYFGPDGLYRFPVEDISRIDMRCRARLLQLAEFLNWPQLSYWDANHVQTVGPGEAIWRKYHEYGCDGTVADLVRALERRAHGEPDRVQKRQQLYDEEED